jgi:ribosomal protein S18 acetylase RimI-like enzyme
MSITLRRAAPQDVPALARFAEETFRLTFVEGFAVGYPEPDLDSFLTRSYALDQVEGWIADPSGRVMLAEDSAGLLLGYAQAGDNTLPYAHAAPGDGELKRIYVRRDMQGAGLGRSLFERALDWFGDRTVLLGVWSGNLKAQRFYTHYGFEQVGEYRFMVGATADEEFILRRERPGRAGLAR